MNTLDRSPEAQEALFTELRRAKAAFPDMRTSQIIYNALSSPTEYQIYNTEDFALARAIRKWLSSMLGGKE